MTSRIRLSAVWPGRPEPLASIKARFRSFLSLSQSPPGRSWHCIIQPRPETEEEAEDISRYHDVGADPEYIGEYVEGAQEAAVAWGARAGVGFDEDLFAMVPGQKPSIDDPHICWWVGTPGRNYFQMDSAGTQAADLGPDGVSDPHFTAYGVVRHNMLATAAAFAPDWCEAGPVELQRYLDTEVYHRAPIALAWMVWLCPDYAKLVTLPPRYHGLVVEPMNDGSLFMATGKGGFDICNDDCLRKARALHRQIDHLNYVVPFNGHRGRSPRVPPLPEMACAATG